MMVFKRTALWVIAGMSLMAQSPKGLLKLIPAGCEHVELTWTPAASEAAYKATMTGIDSQPDMIGLAGKTHLSVKDLAPGPVAIAVWGTPEAKEGEAVAPAGEVVVVPVKDARAFAQKLHAKPAGALQTYTWGAPGDAKVRYFAIRGDFALISASKTLLEDTLKQQGGLEAEFEPLMPWISHRDTVMVVTASGTARAMAKMEASLHSEASPNPAQAFIGQELQGWATKAKASVHHLAMALDFPASGVVRLSGRAFFSPVSALAKEAALSPVPAKPLLGVMPEGTYAMAMGGRYPEALNVFEQIGLQDPSLTEAQRAEMKAMMEKSHGLVDTFTFRMDTPAEGLPLFSGISTFMRVKNLEAWLAATKAQGDAAVARLGEAMSVEYGQLDGRPTITTRVDLAAITKGKVAPEQAGMFSALLFGGRMVTTQAAVDDHNIVMVFGDKDLARKAMTQVKQGPAFTGLGALETHLPEGARFGIYFQPKGIQSLIQRITSTLGMPNRAASSVPDVPPMGGVFTMDESGLQFTGVAKAETVMAFKQVFDGLGASKPGGKTAPSPSKKTK